MASQPPSRLLPNTPANQILKETPVNALVVAATQLSATAQSSSDDAASSSDEDSSSDDENGTRVADQVLSEAEKRAEENSPVTVLETKKEAADTAVAQKPTVKAAATTASNKRLVCFSCLAQSVYLLSP